MRRPVLATICLLLAFSTAEAQVRFRAFSFDAGMASAGGEQPRAQLGAAAILDIGSHPLEFAVHSSADFALVSGIRLFRTHRLTTGAGVGVIDFGNRSSIGISGAAFYGLPLAPRNAASLQVVARGALTHRTSIVSLSLGMRLAPSRGGLVLGESRRAEITATEAERSWDRLAAQLMLLNNGETSVTSVTATETTITIGFSAAAREQLELDAARVARVLNGSLESLELVVVAPDPFWLSAAITAGGFPAERIRQAASDGPVTIQATRLRRDTAGSAQR